MLHCMCIFMLQYIAATAFCPPKFHINICIRVKESSHGHIPCVLYEGTLKLLFAIIKIQGVAIFATKL